MTVAVGTRVLIRTLRRRLRRQLKVRTRLRRAREAWRMFWPERLPAWTEWEPTVATPQRGQVDVTVDAAGLLGRYAGTVDPDRTVWSLRLEVTNWRAPHPGWAGRLGPLPGVVSHLMWLPEKGRGPARVSVTLAEPVPLGRAIEAARPVLEPVPRPVAGQGVATASPRGRHRYGPSMPAGRLTLCPGSAGGVRWEVDRVADGVTVVAGDTGTPLDCRQEAVLAELGVVSVATGPESPRAQASVLAQLAMTGVVLHHPTLPDGLLPPDLAEVLREPLPATEADPLSWEIRGVRQRRTALREQYVGAPAPPSLSAVLVTKRPRMLVPALAALARQTYPELELVVGLHGADLPPELADRTTGPVVMIAADRTLGQALAEATQVASGDLVTKVDDDDRYGPEHLWDLVLAWHYSGATIAGKGAEFVYVEPRGITVRRRMGAELFTDTVAGGTITMARSDLWAVGGWPPVPRWVDRALLDRVLAEGGLVYRTHPLGFIYTRHGDGHTWEADIDDFLVDPRRTWTGLPTHPEFGT